MRHERAWQAVAFRLILVSAGVAALLAAADSVWRTKPPEQWDEADARLVLANSPWVKNVTAGVARRLTEDQLREGGEMGQPHGVGYDGVDPKGSGPKVSPNIFSGPGGDDRSQRSRPGMVTLKLRWESALPVRLAELKAHESEPPSLAGDGYELAVYGIPAANLQGDPKKLGDPLRKEAALKRDGQKDVKPVAVEVFQRQDDMVVVYRFPLSAEITRRDGQIEFEASIGRIHVARTFLLGEMEFLGKLEL